MESGRLERLVGSAFDVSLSITLDAPRVPAHTTRFQIITVGRYNYPIGSLSGILVVGVQGPEESNLIGVYTNDFVEAMDTATSEFHDVGKQVLLEQTTLSKGRFK